MHSVLYDLRYLQASLSSLEDYLLSRVGQWPLGEAAPAGELAFPPLTIEGILLAQRRLQAQKLPEALETEYQTTFSLIQSIHTRWPAAWDRKTAECFRQRLNLWRGFLDDLFHLPASHVDRYPYEVRLRVMLDLLAQFPAAIPATAIEQLADLDRMLHRHWKPGHFIWEANLQPGFPVEPHWYLYGQLITSR